MVDIGGGAGLREREGNQERKGGDEPSEPHLNKMETEPAALAFTPGLPSAGSQSHRGLRWKFTVISP